MDFGLFHDLCQCEGLTIREDEWVRVGTLGFFDAAKAMQTRCPVCKTYRQQRKTAQEAAEWEGERYMMTVLSFWHCTHCNNAIVVDEGGGAPLEHYFPDIAHWTIGRDIKEGVTVSVSMERGVGRLTREGVAWTSWEAIKRDCHELDRQLARETREDLRHEREESEADKERS